MELDAADHGDVVLERSGGGKHYSGRDKLAKLRTIKRKTKNETISPQKLLTTRYVVLMYCSSENVESTRALDNAVPISARTPAVSISQCYR